MSISNLTDLEQPWRRKVRDAINDGPQGIIAYVTGSSSDQTGITSLTDLTGLEVTYDQVAGRAYSVRFCCFLTQRTSTGSIVAAIRTGASTTTREHRFTSIATNENFGVLMDEFGVASSTATVNRKGSVSTSAGTLDVEGSDGRFRAYLYVVDLGVAP